MIRRLTFALLVGFTAAAFAQSPPTPLEGSAQAQADIARIKARYPKTQFESIAPTPVGGIYQAILANNKRLVYIDREGRYFIFGRIFDVERQEDLTEPVLASLEVIDVSSLPVADAITTVRGNGQRTLYVFSDPECPYCRELEKKLVGLTDVTIHTFVFPISEIHPTARAKAIAVWCAKDKQEAWKAVMAGQKVVDGPMASDHPIDRNVALARVLHVNATPTMFSADGRVLRGAAEPDRIAAFLDLANRVAKVAK